ncbi:tetratricopeptide repeat protein [bacterium]|nr:MAG: tetratricopeptide repeat protein [bacterium]
MDAYAAIADLFQTPKEEKPQVFVEGRTVDESRALGEASLEDNNFESAVRHFRRAVELSEPGDVEAMHDLAGVLAASDQLPEAMRQYQKALKAKQEPDPLIGISELYKRYGRYRDSLEPLQKAIELEPANPYHHYKLAETLRDMGERKKALAAIQNAILVKPDESFYHYFAGELFLAMGRFEEALPAYRAAVELSPGDDFLYLRTAVAFYLADKPAETIKAIRLASDLNPDEDLYQALLEKISDEPSAARPPKLDRYDEERLRRLMVEMDIV